MGESTPIEAKQNGGNQDGTRRTTRTFMKSLGVDYDQDISPRSHSRPPRTDQFSVEVLARVPGYPAVVEVWNRTGWSRLGCCTKYSSTHHVWGRVQTGLQFHSTVPTNLAPIKNLNSDRIMTSSVRKFCITCRSFTSRFQICHPTEIC